MSRDVEGRVSNMLARGFVRLVNAGLKMQGLQIGLLSNETVDDIEHVEPYGFTSHPKQGAEAFAAFFDGDRSHGVVLCVADRRYRIKAMEAGEVAIYDDQGQKIHLTRAGIVIDGAGLPVLIENTPSVTADTPNFIMTGDLKVDGSIVADGDISDHTDKSMAGMREVYNSHTHPENNSSGGNTSEPNQDM